MTRYEISIHVPHTRYDVRLTNFAYPATISIHVPHTRYDMPAANTATPAANFNPRTSYEVRLTVKTNLAQWLISIHVPHTRYDRIWSNQDALRSISIHVPHTRYDEVTAKGLSMPRFQSTYLIRGTTLIRMALIAWSRFQSTYLIRGTTEKMEVKD